ncbi:shikimate kinase [Nitrococcus mobilis]|uniref:Shikimate kinase n=1 Tax=Nitrococcus mobilis Nb-231 TaxID=314278 RepID=A4BSP1_9GAMM|nr:shikimate kinase [Nitrococcus mobilis]EAR21311.1 shikimate kinase [Nitrococcus mobilis Nb-231]
MADERNNIVLIGMPGAGKSTIGVLLAKQLAKNFVDTDVIIQSVEGRTLQHIVDHEGHLALRAIEERELTQLSLSNHIIATGGSAAYSERAMAALRRNGVIVYLKVGYPTLARRVTNLGSRGIAKAAHQTLADVFAERIPLYEQHADIVIDCDSLNQEQIVESICTALGNHPHRQ